MKHKLFILIAFIGFSTNAFCQVRDDLAFYVATNYKVAMQLKYQCDWIYTFVKVKLDHNNVIQNYECLNTYQNNNAPNVNLKESLKFLLGYKIKELKSFGKPLLFYFSVANSKDCVPKVSDDLPLPNGAIQTYIENIEKVRKTDPTVVVYDKPIIVYPFSKEY